MPLMFKDLLNNLSKSKYFSSRFELSNNDPNIEFYADPEGRSKRYYMI